MISLKLINNDLVFDGQNKLLMISDDDELAQSCERTLSTDPLAGIVFSTCVQN